MAVKRDILRAIKLLDAMRAPSDIYDRFIVSLSHAELKRLAKKLGVDVRKPWRKKR